MSTRVRGEELTGTPTFGLADYYLTSIGVGIRALLGRHRREAIGRLVNPLSYPRYMEFQLALGQLGQLDGCRVLDIGSPKLPALVLARHAGCELYATDIRDYFIDSTADFLNCLGLGERIGRDLHLEVQDARSLTYDDSFFDRVFSISVIEHIPDDGDSTALAEIARVLRPGGVVSLTVPFSGRGYREESLQGDVYERLGSGHPTFYQRHYDLPALDARIVAPSGLELVERVFFGEPRIKFEPLWNRIPMMWKLPLLWAQPFLAKGFLKRLDEGNLDVACGVAIKLRKPGAQKPLG